MQFIVIILFVIFSLLDLISTMPRYIGSQLEINASGSSFQNIVNTVKRFFVTLLGPAIGILSLSFTVTELIFVFALATLISIFVFVLALCYYNFILTYITKVMMDYKRGANIGESFFKKSTASDQPSVRLDCIYQSGVNIRVFILCFMIYTLYFNAVFFINVVALLNSDISQVLYQMNGLVTSIGTLLLAFVLDPYLSRSFDEKNAVEENIRGLIVGRLSALIFSTIVYFFVYNLMRVS